MDTARSAYFEIANMSPAALREYAQNAGETARLSVRAILRARLDALYEHAGQEHFPDRAGEPEAAA